MVGKSRLHGKEALTFDDILLLPAESKVLPKETELKTPFCKGIKLNIPLVSAAMDTVTESRTAIAMARQGGIGIIHKNLGSELQAAEVKKVKRSEFLIVSNPVCVRPDDKLSDVFRVRKRQGVSSFPVVDGKKLVGILTRRDTLFEVNTSKKVSEIMTKKVVSIDHKPSIDEAKEILHKYRIEKLPIVDSRGHLIGMLTATDINKQEKFPESSKDKSGSLLVGAAVGTSDNQRIGKLIEADIDVIVVDRIWHSTCCRKCCNT